METLLYNIGDMLSGKFDSPKIKADSLVIDEDRIV